MGDLHALPPRTPNDRTMRAPFGKSPARKFAEGVGALLIMAALAGMFFGVTFAVARAILNWSLGE